MVRAAALIVALLAGQAHAQPRDGERAYKATVKYAAEIGSLAYFIGVCEPYYTPKSVDALLADLTGVSSGVERNDFQLAVEAAWSQMYVRGRQERSRYNFDEAQCERLVESNRRDIEAARVTFDREMKAAIAPLPQPSGDR